MKKKIDISTMANKKEAKNNGHKGFSWVKKTEFSPYEFGSYISKRRKKK